MNPAPPKTRWHYIYLLSFKVEDRIYNGTDLTKLKSKLGITKKGGAG